MEKNWNFEKIFTCSSEKSWMEPRVGTLPSETIDNSNFFAPFNRSISSMKVAKGILYTRGLTLFGPYHPKIKNLSKTDQLFSEML